MKKSLNSNQTHFKIKLYLFGVILIAANFLVSSLVRNLNLFHVKNYFPASFGFGLLSSVLILGLVFAFIHKQRFLYKHPILSTFIIAGVISNFLEYTIFGFVIDYINVGIAVINFADLQIYTGLIMLNWRMLVAKQIKNLDKVYHK